MNIECLREKPKGKKPVVEQDNPESVNRVDNGILHEPKTMERRASEQVLEVVDSIKLHEAVVNETVLEENLNNIQLHSIVREGIQKDSTVDGSEETNEQWQTVQHKKKDLSNRSDKELIVRPGSPSTPPNG
ncbi:hypothetical protein RIF29_25077 [Crotalaria pallida]|uniref:Uncharacterized protein n=1 Tax=Crotalaria pallida TaxID=3830 RepID=A0AAN9EKX1_CROPI